MQLSRDLHRLKANSKYIQVSIDRSKCRHRQVGVRLGGRRVRKKKLPLNTKTFAELLHFYDVI